MSFNVIPPSPSGPESGYFLLLKSHVCNILHFTNMTTLGDLHKPQRSLIYSIHHFILPPFISLRPLFSKPCSLCFKDNTSQISTVLRLFEIFLNLCRQMLTSHKNFLPNPWLFRIQDHLHF
jgi:hypothetical protein